ncbi:MAG: hypothetical protein Q9162_005440 [Coniocarpon cinnabarinum]
MVRPHLPFRLSGTSSLHASSTPHRSPKTSQGPTSAPQPPAAPSKMATHGNMQLMLRVKVIKARNLAAKDKSGSSDPVRFLPIRRPVPRRPHADPLATT